MVSFYLEKTIKATEKGRIRRDIVNRVRKDKEMMYSIQKNTTITIHWLFYNQFRMTVTVEWYIYKLTIIDDSKYNMFLLAG